jgi:hypothetical protein
MSSQQLVKLFDEFFAETTSVESHAPTVDEGGAMSLRNVLSTFMQSSEATAAQLRTSLAAADARVAQLEDEVATLEQKRAEASGKALNGELRIAVLTAEVASCQNRLSSLVAANEAAVADRNEMAVRHRKAEEQQVESSAKVASLSEKVTALELELHQKETQITTAAAKLASIVDRGERDRRSLADLMGELDDVKRESAEREDSVRSLRSQVSALSTARSAAERELSLSLRRHQQAEDARRKLELEWNEHRASTANLQYRLEDLIRERAAYDGKVEQLRVQLRRSEMKTSSALREVESLMVKMQSLEDLRRLEGRAQASALSLHRTPGRSSALTLSSRLSRVDIVEDAAAESQPSVAELLFRDSQRQHLELDAVLNDALVRLDEVSSALRIAETRFADAESKCQASLFELSVVQSEKEKIAELLREATTQLRKLELQGARTQDAIAALEARAVGAEADTLAADERASRAQQELDAIQQRCAVTDLHAAVNAKKLRSAHEELFELQRINKALSARLDELSGKVTRAENERQAATSMAQAVSAKFVDLSAQVLHGELVARELDLKLSAATELHCVMLLRAVEAEMGMVSHQRTIGGLEARGVVLSRQLADADHRQKTLQGVAREAEKRAEECLRCFYDMRKEHLQRCEELRRNAVSLAHATEQEQLLRAQLESLSGSVAALQARSAHEASVRRELERRVQLFTCGADVLTPDQARNLLEGLQGVLQNLRDARPAPVQCWGSGPATPLLRPFYPSEAWGMVSHLDFVEHVSRLHIVLMEQEWRSSVAVAIAATSERALVSLDESLRVAQTVSEQCLRFVHGYVSQQTAAVRVHSLVFDFFSDLFRSHIHCVEGVGTIVDAVTKVLQSASALSSFTREDDDRMMRQMEMVEADQNVSKSFTVDLFLQKSVTKLIQPLLDALRQMPPVTPLGSPERLDDVRAMGTFTLSSACPAESIAIFAREMCDAMVLARGERVHRPLQPPLCRVNESCEGVAAVSLDTLMVLTAAADAAVSSSRSVERINEGLREANSELLQRWEIVCDGHMYAAATVLEHMRQYIFDVLLPAIAGAFYVAKEGTFVVAQRGVLLELALDRSLPFSGGGGGIFASPSTSPSNVLAAMGARAFLRGRIRHCETETQTQAPPTCAVACCQTDPWFDEVLAARDHELGRQVVAQEEACCRHSVEQLQAAAFSSLQEADVAHRRVLFEFYCRELQERHEVLHRRNEEEHSLRTKRILEQSSAAMAQTTARLKVALERSTALEIELQQYRRVARAAEPNLQLTRSEPAASVKADSFTQTAVNEEEAREQQNITRRESEIMMATIERQRANEALLTHRIHELEEALHTRSMTATSPIHPRRDSGIQASSEIDFPLSPSIPAVTPLKSSAAVEARVAASTTPSGLVFSGAKDYLLPTAPASSAPQLQPASSRLAAGDPSLTLIEPHSGRGFDPALQFQQRQMLIALSRSERQARFKLLEVEKQLLSATSTNAWFSVRCQALARCTRRLEELAMAAHDADLAARRRALGAMSVATQTQVDDFMNPEKDGGRRKQGSVLASLGAAFGGRRWSVAEEREKS